MRITYEDNVMCPEPSNAHVPSVGPGPFGPASGQRESAARSVSRSDSVVAITADGS
jgi:hypothetical protein